MKQTEGIIGLKEFIAIAILMVGVKLSDATPQLLFKDLGNAAWIGNILGALFAIIPIYIIVRLLLLYEDDSLVDIIKNLFGKYLGFLTLLTILLIYIGFLTFETALVVNLIGTMYYIDTPPIIIYILLMSVCAYSAKRGLEQIGSVAWIVLPHIKISLFFAFVLTISSAKIDFLFPLLGPGSWEIVKKSASNSILYFDFIYLAFLAHFVSNKKVFKKGLSIAFLVIVVEITLALIIYIALFDIKTAELLSYPFHEVIRFIHIGFIANIEMSFFPFWILSIFMRFTILLYITGYLFSVLAKIKQFEYIIPALATIILLLGMMPDSPAITITMMRQKLGTFAAFVFFIIPISLWIRAVFKGDFKNDQAS